MYLQSSMSSRSQTLVAFINSSSDGVLEKSYSAMSVTGNRGPAHQERGLLLCCALRHQIVHVVAILVGERRHHVRKTEPEPRHCVHLIVVAPAGELDQLRFQVIEPRTTLVKTNCVAAHPRLYRPCATG